MRTGPIFCGALMQNSRSGAGDRDLVTIAQVAGYSLRGAQSVPHRIEDKTRSPSGRSANTNSRLESSQRAMTVPVASPERHLGLPAHSGEAEDVYREVCRLPTPRRRAENRSGRTRLPATSCADLADGPIGASVARSLRVRSRPSVPASATAYTGRPELSTPADTSAARERTD